MRRFLAAILVLLFSYTLIAPAFVAQSDALLPACCRRAGMHHCSMMSATDGDAAIDQHAHHANFTAPRCAMFPHAAIVGNAAFFTPDTSRLHTSFVASPSLLAEAQTSHRISSPRAHPKRGPPALSA
jgi:hypothetical protein